MRTGSERSIDPWDLEKYLANQSGYRFGAQGGVISSCFASASDSDKKQAVAKYYYLNNRLRSADLSAIQMVASINSVLGESLMKGLSPDKCKDYLMKDRTAACEFYGNIGKTNCQPQGGLDDMVGPTKKALGMREMLQTRHPSQV